MSPNVALSVIIRMFAALLITSAICGTSLIVFGFPDPNGSAIPFRGEARAWHLAGSLLPAGILWIYASELSRWLIGSFDRPIVSGVRAAALITVALNSGSFVVSVYSLLNLSEVANSFGAQINPASASIERHVATIFFYTLSIAIILIAPKIDTMLIKRARVNEIRSDIESEEN